MSAKKNEVVKIERFLSLDEAAGYLAMTPRALSDAARAGRVRSYRPSKSLIFDPQDLKEFAKRHIAYRLAK